MTSHDFLVHGQLVFTHLDWAGTTREPRQDEENGKHFFFVSFSEFHIMGAAGAFLEQGKSGQHHYATLRYSEAMKLSEKLQKDNRYVHKNTSTLALAYTLARTNGTVLIWTCVDLLFDLSMPAVATSSVPTAATIFQHSETTALRLMRPLHQAGRNLVPTMLQSGSPCLRMH